MARACDICGKRPQLGNKVSHANNKTRTRWLPNLKKVHCIENGQPKTMRICTNCIKSGRIKKRAA